MTMKKLPRLALPIFCLSVFLICSSCTTTSKRVMVRAWSSDSYERNMPDGVVPEPEVYALFRGQFEAGSIRDDSLLGVPDFLEVVGYLKKALLTQNYVMAKPDQPIDLLIVVHWGQTYIAEETIYYEFEDEEGFVEVLEVEQITDKSLWENSLILGTADRVYDWGPNFQREEAIATTSDERYYFVLVAYDFQELLQRKKTVRWVTQFSVDTSGTNYLDALPAMTRVASQYFGKNLKDLEFDRTHLGEGEVEFGEIEVIGIEEEPEVKK